MLILVLLIITALGFDFTNGFHDTGNAMATSIATGALKPKVAVGLSAILNLVGAFLSVEVAATITKNVLHLQSKSGGLVGGISANEALLIIFAGLIGGILWNLFTWLFGLPSSSSHALFGGLIGSGIAAMGTSGIDWHGVLSKIIIPRWHLRSSRARWPRSAPGWSSRSPRKCLSHARKAGSAPADRHRLAGLAGPRHR